MKLMRTAFVLLLLNASIQASSVITQNLPVRSDGKLNPTEMVVMGIVTSSPDMVEAGLKKGAYLRAQLDQFGDTPLMLAIRIFGHSMKTQLEEKASRWQRLGGFASGMVISQLVLWQTAKLVPPNWQTAFNLFNLAALLGPIVHFARKSMKPSVETQRAARIILMLLQQDTQSDMRNYESLTPKDILEAFYPIARSLECQEWFALRKLFSQISPN